MILVNDNPKYEDDVDKYLFPLSQRINEENVEKFIRNFQDNKLEKTIFTENSDKKDLIPGIKRLVGSNYENYIFRETIGKDVLFFLHSDFSYQNEIVLRRIENLYKKLSDNSNLLFAATNPLLNEIQIFSYQHLPTLYIIKGNSEEERRKSIKEYYVEKFNTKALVDFVKEFSSTPITEKALENEEHVYAEEVKDNFESNKKDVEEDLIDFEHHNAGLRRYTKYLLNDDDEDEDEEDDQEQDSQEDEKKNEAVKDDL